MPHGAARACSAASDFLPGQTELAQSMAYGVGHATRPSYILTKRLGDLTIQINDTFQHEGRKYAVACISEGTLFNPAILDLQPFAASTACYRGYQAVFGLIGKRLVLDALQVNLLQQGTSHRREGPTINGVKPTGSRYEYDLFNNNYYGIGFPLEYSGGVLLGDGFIRNWFVHMGLHPALKYERVVELIFESGILKREFDRSEQMAEVRARVADSPSVGDSQSKPTDDEFAELLERAFDRRYRM